VIGELLLDGVVAGVRRRDNLADPIRRDRDDDARRTLGHALAPPPRDIRTKLLPGSEVDQHLGRDPPAAGKASPGSSIEGPEQAADPGLRYSVLGRGLFRDEGSVDDLVSLPVAGEGQEVREARVATRREFFGRGVHRSIIASSRIEGCMSGGGMGVESRPS